MRRIEEWTRRIEIWINELKNQYYIKLEDVEFEGFTTTERLDYKEAIKGPFTPMKPGTKWGKKWEYGWFRGVVTIPKEAKNKRIFLQPRVGGEMLVWVNGVVSGAVDLEHDGIDLTTDAIPGTKYEIVIESYAGHGPRLENGGPYPPEVIPVPEPPTYQVVVGESDFGIWNEEAFQLSMDSEVLFQLYQSLDIKSLRAQKIREGLKEFTKIVDFELPLEERNKTYVEGRKVLAPLLECVNGSTAPMYTIFGQSHLDLAWKWTWDETRRKGARTLSTQIALSDEYPEYKFLICQPALIESVKNDYPELYKRVKEKVENGQFIPEGVSWVESDTNIPSGESLIRQFMWGKRWFKEEFGVDSRMLWLPDCFGFTGQLPQIIKGTGIDYFTSQKLSRPIKGSAVFPYNIFMWTGIDKSQVLTFFYKENNSKYNPHFLLDRWENDRKQLDDIDTYMFPFGYGDGGGGPTRDMLEMTRRTKDLENLPRTKMESPINFFTNIEDKGLPTKNYVGELYLAWHQGTLTAQAKTKQGNRKGEFLLRELDLWLSIVEQGLVDKSLESDKEKKIPNKIKRKIDELWGRLLFNQFHDIIAGASIRKVHEEAESDYMYIQKEGSKILSNILNKIKTGNNINGIDGDKTSGLTIFNSLSWDRTAYIELPGDIGKIYNYEQEKIPFQKIDEKIIAKVTIPSCGHTTVYPITSDDSTQESQDTDETNVKTYSSGDLNKTWILENEYIKVEINNYGQITSIYDKEEDFEYASGLCNEICMYKDVNIDYDAWEMSSFHEELPVELDGKAKIEIITQGNLIGKIRIEKKLNNSTMIQDIVLKSQSRRVDFETKINWNERHKLLKVRFPVNILTEESIEDIQFGYIKRPTHRSRPYDSDRFEVCNHKYTALTESNRTFAVLNDSKYGVSTLDNCISLSLLRAPLIPDMYADQGEQEFTYSFYAYNGGFDDCNVIREGYELNVPVNTREGNAGKTSYFRINDPNVIIETIKSAEDGSGDIILRLYESSKGHRRCSLETCFKIKEADETNMLEEKHESINFEINEENNTTMELNFRPFEIKTLRLKVEE